MDLIMRETYANQKTCFFQVLFQAAAWVILGIFSVKRFEADYVLVVAVCASLGIANIVAFTKCRKGYSVHIQMPRSKFKDLHPRLLRLISHLPYGLHLVQCKLSKQKLSRYFTSFCFCDGQLRVSTTVQSFLEFLNPFYFLKYTKTVREIYVKIERTKKLQKVFQIHLFFNKKMSLTVLLFATRSYAFKT
ncbi:uncharacterized protein LOC133682157 isoform X1 [Populus nigra]|uniref:uncharacterized protein LOC133682157 isoform X1 n=1 Tax=Populus nigra TaxID=3691 RepID=UPI002B269548|nr:uncharacterized protein LOC133682157 isoform X1 [Populus nigra]XP_061961407.1 uncharacterized protein LOC133682157 isoform X1 [Populus nigra]XP_061961408.1 uncharacterized protein LOC133682157 isoform X1 [Populus nigra]